MKPFRSAALIALLPLAPALAQQAGDPHLIRSFMEGCLASSGGNGPGPEAEEAREVCKCTARALFQGEPGTDPGEAMMQCSPAFQILMGGD